MKRIIVFAALAVALTATTALAAAATTARAAAPVHEWISVDDTFSWDDCGFVVEERVVATLHFVSWYEPSGARTRQIVTAPGARITWTNAATGASVTSVNPYVAHKRDNADGTTTIAFTGLVFAIPGGGRAHVESGREVIVFSNGQVELLSSVGPSADLCDALSATIG